MSYTWRFGTRAEDVRTVYGKEKCLILNRQPPCDRGRRGRRWAKRKGKKA